VKRKAWSAWREEKRTSGGGMLNVKNNLDG